jgi:hypothetical protein
MARCGADAPAKIFSFRRPYGGFPRTIHPGKFLVLHEQQSGSRVAVKSAST